MNTTPVYDLRERLFMAAIAGTQLLSEDFRLKRAYEAFVPLESASPVFAKAGQLTKQLLSPDCQNPQGILLDTLSLIDAVICTLGAVDIAGELEEPDRINTGDSTAARIINAPCSKVKALFEALTTSGSGNYAFVCDMYTSNPEVFADYRIRYAMVQALGASYAELADTVQDWLSEQDDTLVPLLKKGFDPRGKKGMVRRVQLIEKLAGAAENDFYINMLQTAIGEVRTALIEALEHEPSNIDILLNMEKTEKGKNKQTVLRMLAFKEDARCYELFHALVAKKPAEVCGYLTPSTTEWASRIIAAMCEERLADIMALSQSDWGSAEADKLMELLCQSIQALIGKHGDTVCACYRNLLSHTDILEQAGRRKLAQNLLRLKLFEKTSHFNEAKEASSLDFLRGYKNPVRSREFSWELQIGDLLVQSLVMNLDEDLKKLALELYENNTEKIKNINFLTAATIVKILEQEDCTAWLDANAAGQSEIDEMWRAFVCFQWDRNLRSFVANMECMQMLGDQLFYKTVFHKVQIPHAKKITDWMMRHSGSSTDAVLNRWVDTTDAAECAKYGKYFYERALVIVDNEVYLRYMRNCGWKQCKRLGTDFAKTKVSSVDGLWRLNYYLYNMPGDAQALLEEADAVVDLVRTSQVELAQLDEPEKIEAWATHLKDLKVYNALRDDR